MIRGTSAGLPAGLLTAEASPSRLSGRSIVGGKNFRRVRLLVAGLLFVGWISLLAYASLNKSRSPIVSHIQVAVATVAVVADVPATDDRPAAHATVVEPLTEGGPPAGTELSVLNLPTVRGFQGAGRYLLLLEEEPWFAKQGSERPPLSVVGRQRSPGVDPNSGSRPTIYPWSDDVRKQVEQLLLQKAHANAR
jgi:hypothetical protein